MLYTLVMEFASPTFLNVPLSLSVVIWCAVGGRASLLGAALGAILVTGVQSSLSETPAFLNVWMLIMGGIFIAVVLFLPKGFVWTTGDRRDRRKAPEAAASTADQAATETGKSATSMAAKLKVQ